MNPQLSGAGDRVGIVLVTWALTQAASKGWITTSDVAVLAPALALLPAIAIGWYKNRATSIAANFSALPTTTAVTTSDQAVANAMKAADPNTVVTVKP